MAEAADLRKGTSICKSTSSIRLAFDASFSGTKTAGACLGPEMNRFWMMLNYGILQRDTLAGLCLLTVVKLPQPFALLIIQQHVIARRTLM